MSIKRSVSEVENKADYAELRRLYFGPREIDNTPSHSKVSSYETGIDQSLGDFTSDLHHLLKDEQESDERLEPQQQAEMTEFKSQISQRSTEIINALYDKYGNSTYNKITSMIHNEDFSDWDLLEQELLANQINPELISAELEELQPIVYESLGLEESFEELSMDDMNDDLDYLDALVQHDYGRLRKFQSDQECLSSIFTEILENEPTSNKNYQDEVFNKNIDLIFNSEIDLDSTEWVSEDKVESDLMAVNLDEAINQLKEQYQEVEMLNPTQTNVEQSDLNAFYAEEKIENDLDNQDDIDSLVTFSSTSKMKKEKSLSRGLVLYIVVTCVILIGIFLFAFLK